MTVQGLGAERSLALSTVRGRVEEEVPNIGPAPARVTIERRAFRSGRPALRPPLLGSRAGTVQRPPQHFRGRLDPSWRVAATSGAPDPSWL